MSERRRTHERSKQCGASKRVNGAGKRANGQTNGPVLSSGFLAILDHYAVQSVLQGGRVVDDEVVAFE